MLNLSYQTPPANTETLTVILYINMNFHSPQVYQLQYKASEQLLTKDHNYTSSMNNEFPQRLKGFNTTLICCTVSPQILK